MYLKWSAFSAYRQVNRIKFNQIHARPFMLLFGTSTDPQSFQASGKSGWRLDIYMYIYYLLSINYLVRLTYNRSRTMRLKDVMSMIDRLSWSTRFIIFLFCAQSKRMVRESARMALSTTRLTPSTLRRRHIECTIFQCKCIHLVIL